MMIIYSFCENRISRGQNNIFRIGFCPMSLAVRFFLLLHLSIYIKSFPRPLFLSLAKLKRAQKHGVEEKRHAARPTPPHRPRHMNYWLVWSPLPIAHYSTCYEHRADEAYVKKKNRARTIRQTQETRGYFPAHILVSQYERTRVQERYFTVYD